MKILGIETSCDETAAAVVEDGLKVLSNVLASQHDIHATYGGVVPELASRAHVERLNTVIDRALEEAAIGWREVEAVAVTRGPGLVGALLVGLATAKAAALARGVPLVGVNHLEGHVYANFLEHGPPEPPYVALIVSGGHTLLVHMPDLHRYEILGQTLDDAAGEAFDKIARFLGLGFPGGPALDRLAREGDPQAIRFPRAMADSGTYDFSLSGLKTAVVRHVRREQEARNELSLPDLAASFQEAIVDVQVQKTMDAAEAMGVRTVLLGGGVVANSRLRERMAAEAEGRGVRLLSPPLELCTDNAAMIASAGYFRLQRGEILPFDAGADPGLPLS
ncbi:MAG TPA: tRNA (adenosine(37)-N6)-threonylcarbamoyltransferase complex transferase subunit TsaD [Actinomycetota bacterium]|nr:tRNA (adenosine(37)-N6)-threonylcarbamoyltransferase complex transferase subunit TsaD [Actinomycetota bacterium]